MGPVHPSTHGVLRLILELDGENVRETRVDTGYLHTGIEKNMEYRTWAQGVTLRAPAWTTWLPSSRRSPTASASRSSSASPTTSPSARPVIRILLMELNRIASHLVAIGSTGNEMGATTIMTIGFRWPRGDPAHLRDDHRPAHEPRVHPPRRRRAGHRRGHHGLTSVTVCADCRKDIGELEDILVENPIFKTRLCDVGVMPLSGAHGPRPDRARRARRRPAPGPAQEPALLRLRELRVRCPHLRQVRRLQPPMVRFDECYESLKIVSQCLDRLDELDASGEDPATPRWSPTRTSPGPPAWRSPPTARASRLEHVREIMGESMESLIHHFKLVTEGFHVPAGQVYQTVEHAKGILGVHPSPTVARARTGRTSATPPSPTCRRWP